MRARVFILILLLSIGGSTSSQAETGSPGKGIGGFLYEAARMYFLPGEVSQTNGKKKKTREEEEQEAYLKQLQDDNSEGQKARHQLRQFQARQREFLTSAFAARAAVTVMAGPRLSELNQICQQALADLNQTVESTIEWVSDR